MATSTKLFNSRPLIFQFLLQTRGYRPRKPLWMGRAKSKMFRVAPIPVISTEEETELKKLYNNYRTQFRSIREFCRTEYYLKASSSSQQTLTTKNEDDELLKLLEANDKENQRLAIIREEYLENQAITAFDKLHTNTARMAEIKKETIEQAEAEIREKEILVKSFITPDKLDEAIENALENVVDFNYAISLDGSIQK